MIWGVGLHGYSDFGIIVIILVLLILDFGIIRLLSTSSLINLVFHIKLSLGYYSKFFLIIVSIDEVLNDGPDKTHLHPGHLWDANCDICKLDTLK